MGRYDTVLFDLDGTLTDSAPGILNCVRYALDRMGLPEPEDMLRYLDIEPGAVSIMGLMNDKDHAVQLLIDEDVLDEEEFGCHPCVNTSSLKMKTADVIEKFLPATGHTYTTVHLVGED